MVLLVTTVSLLAGPAHAATSEAAYAYKGPLVIDGRLQAACEAWGVHLDQTRGGALEIRADAGTLVVRDVWYNKTLIFGITRNGNRSQTLATTPFENAGIDVAWSLPGLAIVYPYGFARPNEMEPFELQFDASHLEASSNNPAPPGGAEMWVDDGSGVLAPAGTHFRGWSRLVTTDARTRVEGNVSLYLRDATITIKGQDTVTLGPYRQETGTRSDVPVRQVTIQYHDAFLDLRGVRLEYDAGTGVAACANLKGHATGQLAAYDARGHAHIDGNTIDFEDSVLGFGGSFEWTEAPRDHDGKANDPWLDASASGDLRSLSIDRAPIVDVVSPRPPVAEWSLAAFVAALLVGIASKWGQVVGALYARFGPEKALHHKRRRVTFEAITHQPGSTLPELSTQLNIRYTTLRYHVRVLERTGKVHLVKDGGAWRAWPGRASSEVVVASRRERLSRDAKLGHVVSLLQEGPRAAPDVLDSLVEAFGVTRRGARHIVDRGLKGGLLAWVEHASGRWLRCA